jgi:hypothetical protein
MAETKTFIWVFLLGFASSFVANHAYQTYMADKPVTKKQIADTMDRKLKVV